MAENINPVHTASSPVPNRWKINRKSLKHEVIPHSAYDPHHAEENEQRQKVIELIDKAAAYDYTAEELEILRREIPKIKLRAGFFPRYSAIINRQNYDYEQRRRKIIGTLWDKTAPAYEKFRFKKQLLLHPDLHRSTRYKTKEEKRADLLMAENMAEEDVDLMVVPPAPKRGMVSLIPGLVSIWER